MRKKSKISAEQKKKPSSWDFSNVLIAIGLVLFALWGTHRYLYTRAITLSDSLFTTYRQEATRATPIHIRIGDRISLPIVEAGKINGVWAVSQTSANHVQASASPGQKGNIIIYGHNLNKIFGPLLDVKIGEVVKIRMTDGQLYQYKITDMQQVSPNNTELLRPTHEETLTLYTCAGFFDTLRFVVRATPLQKVL